MRCYVITFIYGINELIRKIFVSSPVYDALIPSTLQSFTVRKLASFVDLEIAFVMFIVKLIFLNNNISIKTK